MIKEVLRYPEFGVDTLLGKTPVVVFDKNGDEIPEFSGRYQDVRAKILARAPKDTKFFHSIWGLKGLEKQEVLRKEW